MSIAKKFSQLMSLDEMVISDSAMSLLTSHHWPGNVRELENTIERAMNCVNDNRLDVEHLPEYLQIGSPTHNHASEEKKQNPVSTKANSQADLSHELYKTSINKVEKDTIYIALKRTDGNHTEAVKILGISRSQLYNKIKKLGI
ncbi:helix-turn-helix domain-containing protein [Neobacillus sp. K501]